MDVLLAVAFIFVVGVGVAFVVSIFLAGSRRKSGHTPPLTEERSNLQQARVNYKIAQRAVRLLEKLVADDMVSVTIPAPIKSEIAKLVHEFYDL